MEPIPAWRTIPTIHITKPSLAAKAKPSQRCLQGLYKTPKHVKGYKDQNLYLEGLDQFQD